MSKFKHILITRFNLSSLNKEWTNSYSNIKAEWMQHRWDLFTQYCLPSILNQSTKDFIWLIYFDKTTSNSYKKKIEELQKKHSIIHPIFKESYEEFMENLSQDILALRGAETTHFISSRIDNDDCFHRDAIKTIQAQFSEQDYHLVNLAKGLSIQTTPSFSASTYCYYSGPFISLIEKIPSEGTLTTVMEKDHHDYFYQKNITQLESTTYWIQVIHKYNIANQLRGRPIKLDLSKSEFGFELQESSSFSYLGRLGKYLLLQWPILSLKNFLKKLMGKAVTFK